MCGIAGSTDDRDARAVRAMCALLHHRGPDDEGIHSDPHAGVSIGTRRLAVMDVAGGHQPLSNEDGTVWVAFNGEIYNHRRLREQLLQRGHRFQTTTDTEVIPHLYEEFGDAFVDALEGMFGLALWDSVRRRLVLARDRFGEKPLFLHERDGELSFASELTPLLRAAPQLSELDPAAIDAFFVFAYVPGPRTIVRGVRQLAPGSMLVWDAQSRRCSERSWFSPPAAGDDSTEPFRLLASEAKRLFEGAVATRMIADVPLGVFLSGGVDSTLVAIAAAQQSSKRLQTFTIGYDVGSVNETLKARSVAERLGAEHHEVTLTLADVAEQAPGLLAGIDQPLADRALVPLRALSEFARPRVTVALGGEGADELFGGYPRYRWLERATRAQKRVPAAVADALGGVARRDGQMPRVLERAARLAPAPLLERNLDWVTAGRRHMRASLYGPAMEAVPSELVLEDLAARAGDRDGASVARWAMHLDQVHYLPDDVLVKTDRASMLASLELRTVFLSRELSELASSVGAPVHLSGGGKALVHDMLPDDLRVRGRVRGYRKTAFRVPAAEWLRGPLATVLDAQLERGAIYGEGFFDRRAATALAREHALGVRDHSDVLWPLLSLGLWVDRFRGVDGPATAPGR
jgi:asparagine synthase (glutamine-hydrolysing)